MAGESSASVCQAAECPRHGRRFSGDHPGRCREVESLVAKFSKMVDVERIERRFAEIVADLGLIDADGDLVADIDHRMAAAVGGDDAYRAGLTRSVMDLMVFLAGAYRSGSWGPPYNRDSPDRWRYGYRYRPGGGVPLTAHSPSTLHRPSQSARYPGPSKRIGFREP